MNTASHKRDFAANARLPGIFALAACIGAVSTLAAYVLLNLIRLFTNLFFFGTLSFAERSPAGNTLGLWVIGVPVLGGLIAQCVKITAAEGIVSRSDLVKPSLSHFEEEHKRERFRRLVPTPARRRFAASRKAG
jgi:hypothetical protein